MNKIRDDIVGQFPEEEFLFVDGYDDAIIGFCNESMRLIYDYSKMVILLMEADGINCEDAVEFLEYNVLNNYQGEKTPIYLQKFGG